MLHHFLLLHSMPGMTGWHRSCLSEGGLYTIDLPCFTVYRCCDATTHWCTLTLYRVQSTCWTKDWHAHNMTRHNAAESQSSIRMSPAQGTLSRRELLVGRQKHPVGFFGTALRCGCNRRMAKEWTLLNILIHVWYELIWDICIGVWRTLENIIFSLFFTSQRCRVQLVFGSNRCSKGAQRRSSQLHKVHLRDFPTRSENYPFDCLKRHILAKRFWPYN